MRGRSPLQTLLFLCLVGLLAMITMLVFPKGGVKLTDSLTLEYENLDDFFGGDYTVALSIEDSLFSIVGIDSVALRDSLDRVAQIRFERVTNIQHSDSTHASLDLFYRSLSSIKKKGGKIRILHYGDSQIEGDRMTRIIRNELQKEFGGIGPGIVPAYPVIPTPLVKQDKSDNWIRFTAYGKKDSTLLHNNFGQLASFSRFAPLADSVVTTDTLSAWLEIKPATYGFYKVRKYSKMKLLLGGNTSPVAIAISADSVLVFTDSLKVNTFNRKIELNFDTTPSVIKIAFSGFDSPDVYGISFEGSNGVIVDNIPLRGASGTLFRRISKSQLKAQYAPEPIRLVILQFGGNSVPYIDTKKRAQNFGNYFKSNLRYLKSILPNASFLVIGPSDMATKVKSEFVTYPMLETIRDEVQKAAKSQGAAYYDMFEVMGGKNSMKDWVAADPALAAADYVHFTSKGANKMALSFYEALRKDYDKYLGIPVKNLESDTVKHAK